MTKRRGRRLRLNDELRDVITRHIRTGSNRATACAAAGVDPRVVARWIERGESTGEQPFAAFAVEVRKAEGELALRLQSIITRAAMGPHAGDWRAAAWSLEKRFPRDYGWLAPARSVEPDGAEGEEPRGGVVFYAMGSRPDRAPA